MVPWASGFLAVQFPGSRLALWIQSGPLHSPTFPSDSSYHALPLPLLHQLHAVATKAIRVRWALGICWLVGVFSVLVPLQAEVDRLCDLPLHTRGQFLLCDIAIGLVLLWHFGWRPARNRLPLEDIGRAICTPFFSSSACERLDPSGHANGGRTEPLRCG